MRLVEESKYDKKRAENSKYVQTLYQTPEDKRDFLLRALTGIVNDEVAESLLKGATPGDVAKDIYKLYFSPESQHPSFVNAATKVVKDTQLENLAFKAVDNWNKQVVAQAQKAAEEAQADEELKTDTMDAEAKAEAERKAEDAAEEKAAKELEDEKDAKEPKNPDNLLATPVDKKEASAQFKTIYNKLAPTLHQKVGNLLKGSSINEVLEKEDGTTLYMLSVSLLNEVAWKSVNYTDISNLVVNVFRNPESYSFSDTDKFNYEIKASDANGEPNGASLEVLISLKKTPKEEEEKPTEEADLLQTQFQDASEQEVIQNLQRLTKDNLEDIKQVMNGYFQKVTLTKTKDEAKGNIYQLHLYIQRPEDVTATDENIWSDFPNDELMDSLAGFVNDIEDYKFSDEDKFAYGVNVSWSPETATNNSNYMNLVYRKSPYSSEELKSDELKKRRKKMLAQGAFDSLKSVFGGTHKKKHY